MKQKRDSLAGIFIGLADILKIIYLSYIKY